MRFSMCCSRKKERIVEAFLIYHVQELMGELEVRAAHNVLEACAQTDTIDKVVFTSSATAIIWQDHHQQDGLPSDVDERNWSDVNFCKKFKVCLLTS